MAIPHQVIVVQNLSKGRWRNVSGKAKFYEIDARRQDLYSMLECEPNMSASIRHIPMCIRGLSLACTTPASTFGAPST